MYRIRLGSGEQTVFKSVEELALGLQSGTVDPAAEVFDRDSSRWMPIEQHPDYAAARSHDELPTQFIDLSSVLLADEPFTGSTPVATEREVSAADAAVSLQAGSVSDSEGGARMESAVPSSDPAEPPQSEKLSERIAPTHAVSRSPSPPSDNNSRWLTLGRGVLFAVIAVGFLTARGTRSDDA